MDSLWASRRISAAVADAPLAALPIACGAGSDTPRPPRTASGRPASIALSAATLMTMAPFNGPPQVRY